MLRRVFSEAPEDFREEERGMYFFHEDLALNGKEVTKEDLDTLDGWTDPDETAG